MATPDDELAKVHAAQRKLYYQISAASTEDVVAAMLAYEFKIRELEERIQQLETRSEDPPEDWRGVLGQDS